MFIDHREIPEGARFATDVCVVGAGAAGITVAIELARAGVDVLVVPGGGVNYSAAYQDLYKGTSDRAIPLERSRIRRFGGTTTVWGGRCIPFDPIDFETRPHVPHSGWPLSWSDIQEYYRRGQQYLDIGTSFSYAVADLLPSAPRHLIEGFDDDIVETDRVEKWSLPTNFARKFGAEIRRSPNIRVVLDGHLVRLQPAGPERIGGLACATRDGTRFTCSARSYVLAMGAFENTRHLLHPTPAHPQGLGNRSGLLGRFFMSHLGGAIAEVAIDEDLQVVNEYERDPDGVYVRRRIHLAADTQREGGLLNFSALLHHPQIHDARHGDPLLSLLFLAKGLRSVALKIPSEYSAELAYGRFTIADHLPHLRNIVSGAPSLLARAPGLVYKRLLRRRKLPSVILKKQSNTYTLQYHTEHAPHPESRLTLTGEEDAHGVRRLHVSMRYSELDVASIVQAHEIIKERFELAGVGTLAYLGDDPRAMVERQISFGGHQLGTTRMARSPLDGVVDVDSRVFGTENLYVAGPSVFPTGSHANPVLTIVALAVRLADHLRRLV